MSLRNTIGRGSNNIVEVRAPGLKGDSGATWRENWATATSYAQNDVVRYIPDGNLYISSTVHTSSGANTPPTDPPWALFAQTGDAEGWANSIRHKLFVDSTGFTLVDRTPTPSAAWEASASYVEVSDDQTYPSKGSGTGIKFSITTDTSGNPFFTVTNPGINYAAPNTIRVIDPGSTSNTAIVTVESLDGDSGYSSKHGSLQSKDWANFTTGFIPIDAKSEDSTGKPDVATSTNLITFAEAHGFVATNQIVFRVITNTAYPSSVGMPDPLVPETIYYVISAGLTTTALSVSATSGGGVVNIATQGTGTLIAGTEYSAKAWAVGGTNVTTTENKGSSKDWAIKTSGVVDAGGSADHSSKAWAIGGTGITDTAAHGAAKQWAVKTDGTVDTDDHSAKAWAVGGIGITDTTAHGSAKEWATEVEDNTVAGAGTYSALHYSAKAAASQLATRATAAAVAAALDSFDDKYLGVMANGYSSATVNTTGTWADESSSITVANTSGIVVGQKFTTVASGYPTNANVLSVTGGVGGTVVISEPFTVPGSTTATQFIGYGVRGTFNVSKDGPGEDNDNGALATGMLYFNTTDDEMRVYDGTNWIAASAGVDVTILEYQYTGMTGYTISPSASPAELNGSTLGFASTESVQVFKNGLLLFPKIGLSANDYSLNATTNTVTFVAALVSGDEVNILVYKTFTVADAVPASTGGAFSGNITAPNQATTGKAIAMALVFG